MTDGLAGGARPGSGAVGSSALALGFAGLLPQVASVSILMLASIAPMQWDRFVPVAAGIALIYPLIILSFLGGIWWGFAMRRSGGQGRLAAIAIMPSLIAIALLASAPASPGWCLVATGSIIALTLIVDRSLVASGDAPSGWMRLRVPLSLGLGGLTILAGILLAQAGTPA